MNGAIATAALAGAVLGSALAWLWMHGRESALVARAKAPVESDLAASRARLEETEKRLAATDAELAAAREEVRAAGAKRIELERNVAELSAQLAEERKAGEAKTALWQQAETALREAFGALSAEALGKNNQAFLELAQTKLGEFQKEAKGELEARQQAVEALLKPVREALDKVGTSLGDIEKQRVGAYAELRTQLEAMTSTHRQLQAETSKLVQALRAPAVRGNWGEQTLRRVVEMAGMLDHCDFREQVPADDPEHRLRPDVLVRLPGERNIVVDAKVPLAAFLEAIEEKDEAVREAKLREHSRQVRTHIAGLAAKSYQDRFQPTPEIVVMFLPTESVFVAALQYDPALIEFGAENRVIPASPITLIALLRAVAYGWRHERLAETAQEISDHARDLYERMRVWLAHFEKVGRNLSQAVGAYNDAAGSLEMRVLPSARKFRELGAAGGDEMAEPETVDRMVRQLQVPELNSGSTGAEGANLPAAASEPPDA